MGPFMYNLPAFHNTSITYPYIFPSFLSICLSVGLSLSARHIIVIVIVISVTPLAVTGRHGQLANLSIVWQLYGRQAFYVSIER